MFQPCASGGAGIVRLQPCLDVYTLVGVAVGGGYWVVHDLKRDRTEILVRHGVETRRPSSTANSTTAASTAPASTSSASTFIGTLALSSPSGVAYASAAPAPFALALAADITIAVAASLAAALTTTAMNAVLVAWHNQLIGPHV